MTEFGTYTYRDIPSKVFPYGVEIIKEGNYFYKLATAEKALCDQLYKMNRVANYKELQSLLFENLRIDEQQYKQLNVDIILFLSEKYGSMNVKRLAGMMRKLYMTRKMQ